MAKKRWLVSIVFGVALGVLLSPLEMWRILAIYATVLAAVGLEEPGSS